MHANDRCRPAHTAGAAEAVQRKYAPNKNWRAMLLSPLPWTLYTAGQRQSTGRWQCRGSQR